MADKSYDVAIIGSGPGGYVAAIRCAQLGMKVALIEKYATLGGTCLNVGCIPSKALLDSSEHFEKLKTQFSEHGIECADPKIDIQRMMMRKADVVKQNVDGVAYLMRKNKIEVIRGVASFADEHTLQIKGEKEASIRANHIIIATGSKPATLPFIKIDKKRVITSTEALSLEKLPKSMVIIGGGIIGVELGSVYARLGTEVHIVEYMDRLIPGMDKDLGRELKKILSKIGIQIHLSHRVKEVKASARQVTVKADDKKGEEQTWKAEYCLVAVGRRPYTEGLALEKAGLKTNEKGMIEVNDRFQTDQPHIYAIGDVIRGPMLAHKAEEEGVAVAEILAGQKPHINYNLIPGVAYTWPEVAAVGATEEELKAEGRAIKVGKFPFKANGRARASMDTDGFIKVIADQKTDEILGVHMIGPRVADLIMEASVAMEFRASAEDVARTCHPHPTYSEAMKEACLAATENRALHI